MLNKTLVLSVIAAALLFNPYSSVTADEKKNFFHIDNTIIRAQGESRKSPLDQLRNTFGRIFRDDSTEQSTPQRPVQNAPPAIPVSPPKPLTGVEIQQSVTTPGQAQSNPAPQRTAPANTGSVPSPRAQTILFDPRINIDEGNDEGESDIFRRMAVLRQTVFTYSDLEKKAIESRQVSPVLSPSAAQHETGNVPGEFGGYPIISSPPGGFPNTTTTANTAENTQEAFLPPAAGTRIPRNDSGDRIFDVSPPQQQAVSPFNVVDVEPRREQPTKQVLVSSAPQVEIEVKHPPSAVVGQEITCQIQATNVGTTPVERVVVNVEIPSWIEVRLADADEGNAVLRPRNDGSGISDLEWKVNRINSGIANHLVLLLVPLVDRTIELPIQHSVYRAPIISRVDIQKPKLEMELLGSDEVLWNKEEPYVLVVRNTGNGNAENVRLELLQTSAPERKATAMERPLRPGEMQEIPLNVKAGRDTEFVDIAVMATGAHDLKGEVQRRIKVLRPKLDMVIQTPPLHFVESPAELFIRVRNTGNADAENVTIRAELPLGAQYESSSEGGITIGSQQQNSVEWRGRTLEIGEMQTFVLTCRPKREGICRVAVEVGEPGGDVLIAKNSTFMAEAVVELDFDVIKPSGPIELGQEVTYTIEVKNVGTKVAENVEVTTMFGSQLEPSAVLGGEAYYTDDGQVLFEKIPGILPGQSVTLKVSVKAKALGTAPIRVEVVRTDAKGASVRLDKGLSAYIFSRQPETAATVGQTQNEVFR